MKLLNPNRNKIGDDFNPYSDTFNDMRELILPLEAPLIPDTDNMPSIGRSISQGEINLLREHLGIHLKDEGHKDHDQLSGWINLSKPVDSHIDGYGHCFLYCGKGSGILWKEQRPVHLSEGFYTTFNDSKKHAFDVLSENCVLLVVNITKGVSPDKKDVFYVR